MTRPRVRRAIEETLRLEGLSPRAIEVSLLLTDDAALADLNRRYRGKEAPTDVLSFAQDTDVVAPGAPKLLGDIVISLDTAAMQAVRQERSLDDEVCWLAIHGTLHLLGYDDATAEGFTEMVRKGTEIWRRLLPDSPPPSSGYQSYGE